MRCSGCSTPCCHCTVYSTCAMHTTPIYVKKPGICRPCIRCSSVSCYDHRLIIASWSSQADSEDAESEGNLFSATELTRHLELAPGKLDLHRQALLGSPGRAGGAAGACRATLQQAHNTSGPAMHLRAIPIGHNSTVARLRSTNGLPWNQQCDGWSPSLRIPVVCLVTCSDTD